MGENIFNDYTCVFADIQLSRRTMGKGEAILGNTARNYLAQGECILDYSSFEHFEKNQVWKIRQELIWFLYFGMLRGNKNGICWLGF